MSEAKQRTTENNGAQFEEWPCLCGTQGCCKTLAITYGVPKGTISLGIREHGSTKMQAYLDFDQAEMLAAELRNMVREATR